VAPRPQTDLRRLSAGGEAFGPALPVGETWGARWGPTPILGDYIFNPKIGFRPLNPQIGNELAKSIHFEQSRMELVKS